jgi:hypothetical protein
VNDAPHIPAAPAPRVSAASGPPAAPGLFAEPDLAVELAREERSERWLLVRQVAIVLVLAALLVTHALLSGGGV